MASHRRARSATVVRQHVRRGGLRCRSAAGVVVLLALLVASCVSPQEPTAVTSPASSTEPVTLSEADLGFLAAEVAARPDGPASVGTGALATPIGPVYAALREGGVLRATGWAGDGPVLDAVRDAVDAAWLAGTEDGADLTDVDAVELAIGHSSRQVQLAPDLPGALSNANRGVLGLELERAGRTTRYSPTWMLATNRSFESVLTSYAEQERMTDAQLRRDVTARVFEAEQVLVTLGGPPSAVRMQRGNALVPVEAVTRDAVQELVAGMEEWLIGAVHDDGRLTYKYWPSRGEESTANNMIRQWMGTTALGRVATRRGDEAVHELSRRNIDYNLAAFYREDGELGLIVEDGVKVKLGAVALAARALVEHPDRGEYAEVEAALRRTVDHLWQPDGSFRTWYLPADGVGQENFYPGEALYLWSALYADDPAPELLERFLSSFEHYRDWHLDEQNRNPAFVPWHTQAYYEMWQLHRDPRLADFVFEMNDWLLEVQQWDGVRHEDVRGRFYDPDRPQFGPPHSASTGVYLEGLVDAYLLATELGEDERAQAYRRAVVRGLRSVMQLQFADDVDSFYISDRGRVDGGIRTTVYNNEIRVDNVQHCLMAGLKVLEAFGPEDYRP